MKSKKSIFSFIKNNKKKIAGLVAIAICFGVYTAIGGVFSEKEVSEDVPLHDGDVLVDSLNVKEMCIRDRENVIGIDSIRA